MHGVLERGPSESTQTRKADQNAGSTLGMASRGLSHRTRALLQTGGEPSTGCGCVLQSWLEETFTADRLQTLNGDTADDVVVSSTCMTAAEIIFLSLFHFHASCDIYAVSMCRPSW
jgi:hypothetical protein